MQASSAALMTASGEQHRDKAELQASMQAVGVVCPHYAPGHMRAYIYKICQCGCGRDTLSTAARRGPFLAFSNVLPPRDCTTMFNGLLSSGSP
jgi:hypothetical protein